MVVADGIGGFERRRDEGPPERRRQKAVLQGRRGPDRQNLHIFMTEDMNSHGAGYGWVFYIGRRPANVGAGVSTAALARTGRNLKDFYDRFLEEPQMVQWLENAHPEGPPRSWSLKMGMWGAKRYGAGRHGGRGRGEHGPPDKRRGRRLRPGVGPPGSLLGPRGSTPGTTSPPRFSLATSASSGTGGHASMSRATRSSTSCPTLMMSSHSSRLARRTRVPAGRWWRLSRATPPSTASSNTPRALTRALKDSVSQRVRS